MEADGRFPSAYDAFTRWYFRGRIRPDEIRLEARRQIESVLDAGLRVTHLNSHQHIHLFPQIWLLMEELADRYIDYLLRKYKNKVKVADILKISRKSLYNRLTRKREEA